MSSWAVEREAGKHGPGKLGAGDHLAVARPPEPTLRAQADETERAARKEAIADPVVQAALEAFPGSEVEDVRQVERPPDFDGEAIDPEPHDGDEAI